MIDKQIHGVNMVCAVCDARPSLVLIGTRFVCGPCFMRIKMKQCEFMDGLIDEVKNDCKDLS